MKTVMTRFLSALLALLMVVGAFTTVLTATIVPIYADETVDPSEDDDNENETTVTELTPDEWMTAFEKLQYVSDLDKLNAMSIKTPVLDENGVQKVDEHGNPVYTYSPYIEKDGYALYVQEDSGEVAIKNTTTGQILFTNPYEALTSVTSKSVFRPMMAQLIISYDTIKTGKTETMNSYADSAARQQIKVSYIKNGICVEYTIGQEDERRLVPFTMEKYRFENVILARIEDPVDLRKMNSFYGCHDMNQSGLTASQIREREAQFPVLEKWDGSSASKTYTSEGYAEGLSGSYSGRMSIYYLSGQEMATNQEKNKIESIIRSWVPEYNYDTLAYDHELTEFVGNKETLPVFKMALEYRIEEDGFVVRLPANSITFDEENFRLNSVQILPYMGAGSNEYTGYTFIPDGSGTIIRFEDFIGTAVSFSSGTLYGPDNAYHTLPVDYKGTAEKMRFPVYGIIEDTTRKYTLKSDGTAEEVCNHRPVIRIVEADCSTGTDYKKYEYCAVCGEELRVLETKACEHNYIGSSAKVLIPATCQSEGKSEMQCKTCNDKLDKEYELNPSSKPDYKTYIVTTPKIEHSYEDFTYADKENHICYEAQHCVNGINPVIGEDGTAVYEMVNGKRVYQYEGVCDQLNPDVELAEIDHTFDPTKHQEVHKNGRCYTIDYCTLCEAIVETDIEHTYGEAVYTEVDGICVKTLTCTLCNHKEITKGLHQPSGEGVKTSDRTNHICYMAYTCKDCGKTHREISDEYHEMVNGVCTDCGYKESYSSEYTYRNGKCYLTIKENGRVVSQTAVDHVYDDIELKDPTCTKAGYYYTECIHCGHEVVIQENVEPALGHNYTVKNDKTGCHEDYHQWEECTTCGNVINKTTVKACGHTYGTPECIIAESEGQLGIYKYTCSFCHEIKFETVEYVAPPKDSEEDDIEKDENKGEDTIVDNTFEITTSNGFFAVITSGSTLASIVAGSGGARHPYNYAYVTVTPRPSDSYNLADSISVGSDQAWTVVSERKYSGSYTIKVYMLQNVSGENVEKTAYKDAEHEATYSGMAAAYRDYLLSKGILTPLEKTDGDIPLYLEAFGSMSIQTSVLTVPTTKQIALTTFDDLQMIVNELKNVTIVNDNGEEEGYSITNVNIRLKGFANGGLSSTMPYKVNFQKVVGGNKGFSDFVSFAKENSVGVYPDFDFAYMQKDKLFDGYSNDDHAVKTIDDRYITKKEYDSTFQIFMNTGLLAVSASVYDYFYTTFNKNYAKFGNMGISVGSLGTDLNSDFDEDEPYNREDTREFTERILEKMANDYGSVMVDGGNAYTLPYVDHVLNMSLTGSNYLKTSEYVPFVSMVLHGNLNYAGTATNMSSDLKIEILRLIENGASPYFIIATQNTRYLKENSEYSKYYSLDYSTWKEDIIDTYRTLNELLKDVQSATFEKHEYIVSERLPDADESAESYRISREAIQKAIAEYNAAKTRVESAEALIKRKTETEPNIYRAQILEILKSGELTEEKMAEIDALKVKIDAAIAVGEKEQYVANLAAAKKDFEAAKASLDAVMDQYAPLYKVEEADRMDPSAYTRDSYVGTYYIDENGKYVLTVTGKIDVDGNVLKSEYVINDSSVVKVSYDNGVSFYLNYNYFDVLVNINGENVLVEAYSFLKV